MNNPFDPNPCKNGHVFYWTSGDTTVPPAVGKCACGIVSVPGAKITFVQNGKVVGIENLEPQTDDLPAKLRDLADHMPTYMIDDCNPLPDAEVAIVRQAADRIEALESESFVSQTQGITEATDVFRRRMSCTTQEKRDEPRADEEVVGGLPGVI